ncbi:MAG: hypothetical protein AABX89_02265 [Candidatus Thermoplasmatota archaeon]
MALRITLDANCIYDLEDPNSPNFEPLDRLRWAHAAGRVRLAISTAVASEKQKGGAPMDEYTQFADRVHATIPQIDQLTTLLYYDFGYWGAGMYSDEAATALDRAIHDILFPEQPFDNASYPAEGRLPSGVHPKWRNRKCDILGMWAHIHHDCDAFVTSDTNFHKATKKEALKQLGAREVWTPAEAVTQLGL